MDMNNTNGKHQLYANANTQARHSLLRQRQRGTPSGGQQPVATPRRPGPLRLRAPWRRLASHPRREIPAPCWVWPSTATGALMRAPMRWLAALAATGLSPAPAAIYFPQE